MAKVKGLPHNTGRLNAYSYHVFDNQPVKVGKNQRFVLADSWYPISAQEQELVILRKVYASCGGVDGNPQYVQSYDSLSRLFLTSDYFVRDGRFFKNENVDYRTRERYGSFVREGYLSDESFGCVSITFHGLKRMEALLKAEAKDSILQQVHILNGLVMNLIDSQKTENVLLSDLNNSFLNYIVTIDRNEKFTVSDGVGVVSDVTTAITNVPDILSIGQKFVRCLPLVTAAIRAVVTNFS